MTDDVRPEPDQPEPKRNERPELEGPAADALAAEEATKAAVSDTFEQAIDGLLEPENLARDKATEPTSEPSAEPGPVAKLERLQKILAQAGIASRRHAEELITGGRVQVNGKVVTELGTKADAARDHIRVDGKLLQGSERLRYFMLNKPKGFVTTVSDPEGRPTIMQFFSKMRERLYPVGRLDYLSEGLLLVTNDGDLANKLTRAASGVEKTYLVKVSGQPSEEDINRLREGVGIDRGKPGSGRVQTAPAEIRRFRPGRPGQNLRGAQRGAENPWYEVVLIEGRNRELRKMFEEIGHHVEKIRRIGYGPLVLDLEPGKLRELEPGEVENLRKAAEGKYHKPKRRETGKPGVRREGYRPGAKTQWKQESGKPGQSGNKPARKDRGRSFESDRRTGPRPESRPESGRYRDFGRTQERGQFQSRTADRRKRPSDTRPRFGEDRPERPPRREDRDRTYGATRESREGFADKRSSQSRPGASRFGDRPPRREFRGTERSGAGQPERRHFERGPGQRSGPSRQNREDRPRFDRPRQEDGNATRQEGRPSRSGGFQSGPRPTGAFKSGKRGAPGAKQGSIRSAGGRRPGSRSGPRPGGKHRP